MWFDEKPKLVTGSFASGEPTTLAEVWDSSFETTLRSENYNAEVAEYSRAYDRRSAAIKNALNVELVNPYSSPVGSTDYIFGIEASNKADPFDFYAAELKRLQEKHPEAAGIIQADIDPRQEARGRQRGAAERAADVYERSGAFGSVASFGGALNAAAYDPLQWMTAILGPTGAARTGAVGIVEMALKQGLANAGVELAFQPKIGQWKAQGGLEHTAGDVMMNVGTAFIFGAGLDAGIRGAYRGVQSYRGMTPIVDGNGGVIGYRKAGTEDQSPPAPAAPAIADETVARAAAGEPAAIREVLEKTGELDDNPALRGALNELETVAEITARDREQFKAMGLDAGEAESAVLRNIRALTDGEPVPLREPSPVRAVEDSMPEIMGAMQRHGSKLDDVAAEVMKDAGLAADPRLKQVIDMALGGDFPELLPAIRAAVAELDAGKDAPAAAKAFTGSLADVLEKTNPDMLAAKATLLMERDPVKAARMIRGNPELVDGSLPLGNDYFDGVRALSSLSEAAFEMVARGEASPALGRVVADYVAPEMQPGILRDLIDHGVPDPEAARIMLPEFLPAPHDMVSDALMGRMLPPAERSAGLRRGAEVDEPAGPAAKKQVERLRQELHAEIAEAKAKPPEMPPQPDPAIARSAEIAKAIAAATRVAPADTEFRTFSKVSELPDNLRTAVEKANAEVDAMFDPVSNAVYLSTAAIDPAGRLHHESVHALKAAGLLTDGEIRLLAERAAKLDDLPFDRAKYEAAYRDRYSEDGLKLALDEEAAAHLVEARSRGVDFGAEINAIADRILQFFERLRNALDGLGFRTADDVVDAILSGEVASRQAIQSVMEAEDLTAVAVRPQPMYALRDGDNVGLETKMANFEAIRAAIDNAPREQRRPLMEGYDVEVWPSVGNVTYYVVERGKKLADKKGNISSVGRFVVKPAQRLNVLGVEVTNAGVSEGHQRKGIARAVYDMAERDFAELGGVSPSPRDQLSSDGKAFWEKRMPGVMFAFAGERAKTADLNALDLAKRMTLDGADRTEVWTRTGWFQGVDGKWRFEIDDSGVALGKKNGKLSRVLKHPDLFSAYPELAMVPTFRMGLIERLINPLSVGGYAEPRPKWFGMSKTRGAMMYDRDRDSRDVLGTLAHEAQHGVQFVEDFARGANANGKLTPGEADKIVSGIAAQRANERFSRETRFNAGRFDENNPWDQAEYVMRLPGVRQFKTPDERMARAIDQLERDDKEFGADTDVYRKAADVLRNDTPRPGATVTADDVQFANSLLSDWLAYRNSAGEVEARTVQKRMDMTAAERRARPPWLDYDVPEDQQIVRFGDGVQNSEPMFAIRQDQETGRSMRRDLDALGYFSGALEAAKALKQAKGTPEQMIAQLKAGGAKQAELEATGLLRWIEEKSGSRGTGADAGSGAVIDPAVVGPNGDRTSGTSGRADRLKQPLVTRDEIVSFLNENRVGLKERDRGIVSEEEFGRRFDALTDFVADEYGLSGHRLHSFTDSIVWNGTDGRRTNPLLDSIEGMANPQFKALIDAAREGARENRFRQHSLDPENPTYRESVVYLGGEPKDMTSIWLGHTTEPNTLGIIISSLHKRDGRTTYLANQIQSDSGQAVRDGRFNYGEPHQLVRSTDAWVGLLLKRALRQAVEAGADEIAIPSGLTVHGYNDGKLSGMQSFYDGIVPKNLRKLIEKIDKDSAKPVKIDQLETPSGMKGNGFTLFQLTDAVKSRVLSEGQPLFAMRQDTLTRMAAPDPDDMARMIEPYIAAYPRIAALLQEQADGIDPAEVLARVAADTETLAEARQALSDAVGPEMAPQVEAAVLRAIVAQEMPDGAADIVQRVMDELMPDEPEATPARAANDNPEPDPFRDSLADVERTADMQMLVEACR